MKIIKQSINLLLGFLILSIGSLTAQVEVQEKEKDLRPVRSTFESIWLIDHQTVMVPFKGTLEMDIQHRFGDIDNGFEDLFGLYAPSKIRFGFVYVPIDKLQIGAGLTSVRLHWDFHLKYALVKQARSGGSPVSVSYLGNIAVDTRDGDNFIEFSDRLSFFNQLMIARKFSDKLSLQVAGNVSHTNFPNRIANEETGAEDLLKSTHLSFSVMGRYKITDGITFLFNYDHPITDHGIDQIEPKSNLAFGIENVTSSHAFQIFIGKHRYMIPQLNQTLNNEITGGDTFVVGFNMTRLWNF
ncbi:MAG: hypothetical protein KJO29_06500 [Bacteroidia bacterium]|nr:hypothetical protein [Bacteroidia bacterium]